MTERVELAFKEFSERATPQRREIADRIVAFGEKGQGFTAEMLLAKLRDDNAGIGRATVYRVIEKLVQCKVLDRIEIAEGERLYRLCRNEGHHHHLVCKDCHRVVEFEMCLPKAEIERVSRRAGFVIEEHEITLFGLCDRCRSSRPAVV
jgi:Fur family ferric uptake transcriptional regulator